MSDLVSQNLNMIFKSPKGETVHALKDLNFTIKKGELLTVLGPSGCCLLYTSDAADDA